MSPNPRSLPVPAFPASGMYQHSEKANMVPVALKIFGIVGFLASSVEYARATTSSDGACDAQENACNGDTVCATCLAAVQSDANVQSGCGDRYAEASTFCELLGASYCCILSDNNNNSLSACMDSQVSVDYFECIVGDIGCAVDDLPCYGGVASTTSSSAGGANTTYGIDPTMSPSAGGGYDGVDSTTTLSSASSGYDGVDPTTSSSTGGANTTSSSGTSQCMIVRLTDCSTLATPKKELCGVCAVCSATPYSRTFRARSLRILRTKKRLLVVFCPASYVND